MTITIQAEPVPLKTSPDGVVLVGSTRVTLATLVAAFGDGATPEEIAHQYPSLELADIYAVIGFVLRHRAGRRIPPSAGVSGRSSPGRQRIAV